MSKAQCDSWIGDEETTIVFFYDQWNQHGSNRLVIHTRCTRVECVLSVDGNVMAFTARHGSVIPLRNAVFLNWAFAVAALDSSVRYGTALMRSARDRLSQRLSLRTSTMTATQGAAHREALRNAAYIYYGNEKSLVGVVAPGVSFNGSTSNSLRLCAVSHCTRMLVVVRLDGNITGMHSGNSAVATSELTGWSFWPTSIDFAASAYTRFSKRIFGDEPLPAIVYD
ncbi:Hypothetical Protein FCC1311_096492 [Hondaea fermentalgiana]|uniref:Uncharacterized protein n=1 Tax=Hondaea fermentalgiana TaxID=2315210 RepID=A0A2R5GRB3_9STRA|nr:Hypothetical Protein FCC1311_096492 [Hondaea fermentalgiana]|eukprot:GBG33426.1 Hypothetical Protein FCC1311_096492 [Hondaea fermentalgiana]